MSQEKVDNRPIGIFDSGVGGLTVVREVINFLPNENIIYFGDTLRCPYGSKDLNDVRKFVFEIIDFLLNEDVKSIVIACNTGTAAGLYEAQSKFKLPIIGVIEPGARGAVLSTRNKKVGVIGTVGTINSGAYQRVIKTLDAGIKVYSNACPEFVEFVERGETTGMKIKKIGEIYLQSLKEAGVDTLILGCTHYPLLSGLIQEIMGSSVKLISSAAETAKELKELIERKEIMREENSPPFYRFLSTGDIKLFLELGKKFLGKEITTVEKVSLSREGVKG